MKGIDGEAYGNIVGHEFSSDITVGGSDDWAHSMGIPIFMVQTLFSFSL